MFLSSVSYADGLDEACVEKASEAIIEYLSAQDPLSDLHLVKNKNTIVGLTDSEEVYPDFDLDPIIENSAKESVVQFSNNGYIAFAVVETMDNNSNSVCNIINVDSGQDDQD
ncbi:MAG: hypothetical protein H6623_02085 [Bdellovibrionaceae bacterium]|nr:hypothetical protein [Pseudobdellovibrionaceae bacterium]